MFIIKIGMVIIYGWVLGVDRGLAELREGAEIPVPRVVKFIIKYLAPLYLIGVFAAWLYNDMPARVSKMGTVEITAVGFIGLVLVLFLLLIGQALKRWQQREPSDQEGSA